MLRKIREILLFSEYPRSDLKAVQQQIMEDNRKFCIIWAAVNILFWIYCLIMTIINPVYHVCRTVYVCAFTACTICFFLSVYAVPKKPGLIRAIAIILDETLLLAGIFIARHLAPQTILVFASVLIVPVVFITETFSTILLLAVNVIVFALVGSRTMEPDTYRWVLTNLCIVSVVGIMIGHFVNRARFERYMFAESKAKLAEMEAWHASRPAGCCVVMADINGLKETNDTFGHQAGDELIIGAAKCLRRSFAGTDRIYRTGGDEFVVIITDKGYDADEALARLKRYSADWKGELIHGVSISAGAASAKENGDINALLKEADQKMYEAKTAYYEKAENNRRGR